MSSGGFEDFYDYLTQLGLTWDEFGAGTLLIRWSADGNPPLPLLTYVPESPSGVSYDARAQVIAAANDWNTNPQGIQYFDISTDSADQSIASIEVIFNANSYTDREYGLDHIITHATAYVGGGNATGTFRAAAEELGHTINLSLDPVGDPESTFGIAPAPTERDKIVAYLVQFLSEQQTSVLTKN